jgi:hypothetical protein
MRRDFHLRPGAHADSLAFFGSQQISGCDFDWQRRSIEIRCARSVEIVQHRDRSIDASGRSISEGRAR